MVARNALRRALLYVPGSSQKFLDKARSLSADCVVYDLEDSVTPHKKADARTLVRRALDRPVPPDIREQAVRINSVASGLALKDLTDVLQSPNLSTIVVPKVNSASDLTFVADVVSHTLTTLPDRPQVSLLALVESAKSITNLSQICSSTPFLQGLIFAAEDFALDLSLTRTPSLTEFLFARSAIVTAARAHDLPSTIDLVCTAYKSLTPDGSPPPVLEEESRDGKRLGFNGKQCIHPSQVATVQRVFSPEPEEVEWAIRVVVADAKATAAGRGAWSLDGKMIDMPVVEKAKAIVRKARVCKGKVDVGAIESRWKDELSM